MKRAAMGSQHIPEPNDNRLGSFLINMWHVYIYDRVLFPVEEHAVFVSVPTESGERRISLPEKKAIVNKKTNRLLGVVSRGYRLVTNREALNWAYQCCWTAFPETKLGEWEVNATDAPATGGHCFIDLVHNSTALDFEFVPTKDRSDAFGLLGT